MSCSIQGCPGEYEERSIVHALENRGRVFVFDKVPAELCSICGDTLLKPETVLKLEKFMGERPASDRMVPLYRYAQG